MKEAASSFAALSLLTLTLAAACNQTPTRPTTAVPQQPPEPGITRLEIQGPASVAPGETVQFTAIAHKTDGTTDRSRLPQPVSCQSGSHQFVLQR